MRNRPIGEEVRDARGDVRAIIEEREGRYIVWHFDGFRSWEANPRGQPTREAAIEEAQEMIGEPEAEVQS